MKPRYSLIRSINWRHPLNRNLVFWGIPNSGIWIDLVSGQVAVPNAAAGALVSHGEEGDGSFSGVASPARWTFPAQTGFDRINGAGTLLVSGRNRAGNTQAYSCVSGSTGTGFSVGIRFDDTIILNNIIGFFNNSNATNAGTNFLGLNSENFVHRVGLSWDGTNHRFHRRNGSSTSTASVILPTASATRLTTLHGNWSAASANMEMYWAMAWDRVLSDEEAQYVLNTPYGTLEQERLRVHSFSFWAEPGPPPNVGLLDVTLGNVSSVASGTIAEPIAGTLNQTLAPLTLLASNSALFGEVNQTLGALTLTASVSGFSAGIAQTSAIRMAWDASVSATGYRIHVGTATQSYDYSINVGNVLTYRLQNLADGTYYFAVTAYNADGDSGFSNELVDTITAIDGLVLDALTLSATTSFTFANDGMLSAVLSALTATSVGTVGVTGSASITLGALTCVSSDAAIIPGPPGIYAPAINPYPITAMPAAVYTALADPDLHYYKVPRGRYTVSTDFAIQKPDFVLDWNGSTISYTPDSTSLFNITSAIDAFVDATSPTRNASHLTGTITAATTTLTMDAAEIMDVTPGEIVTIVAGTNTSDPVEPHRYIQATVQSVAGQVITFTEPLGENITVYANQAALEAVVDPSLHAKIGPWGDDYIGANYHKGLGTDHGLLRYVGGMNHDITVRNFHLDVTIPADASIPVSSGQSFFCRDLLNLTIKNFSMMNVILAPVHTWRCDNVLVENFKIRGTARAAIFDPGTTHVGYMMTAWGGTGISYRNGDVNCRNIMFSNTEVSPADVLFQNIRLVSDAAGDWSSVSSAVLMGFHGNTLGSGVRIEDTLIKPTGYFTFDSGRPITFENLVIDDTVFHAYFNFALHPIEGTFTINGDAYGPLAADTETIVLGAGNGQTIKPPKGFYKSARLRVTVPGGATAIGDQFGNSYTGAIASGTWTNVNENWLRLQPEVPISSYDYQTTFVFNITGASMTVEFEVQYYPHPTPTGWLVS